MSGFRCLDLDPLRRFTVAGGDRDLDGNIICLRGGEDRMLIISASSEINVYI